MMSGMSQLPVIGEKSRGQQAFVHVLVELDEQIVEVRKDAEEAARAPGGRGFAEPVLEVRVEKERRIPAFAQQKHVADEGREELQAVSYTHLTLPTNREV